MKLHRDLKIRQGTAWHLLHRIREAMAGATLCSVALWKRMRPTLAARKPTSTNPRSSGRGAVGKTPVVGVKDRETNQVSAAPVERTDKSTLQDFVEERTETSAIVYTDEARAYIGMGRHHEAMRP